MAERASEQPQSKEVQPVNIEFKTRIAQEVVLGHIITDLELYTPFELNMFADSLDQGTKDPEKIRQEEQLRQGYDELRKTAAVLITSLDWEFDQTNLLSKGLYQLIPDHQFQTWITGPADHPGQILLAKHAAYFFDRKKST
jgi:hypothetical protein